jgi:DNA-binding transcriptional MocR family regulator
MIRDLTTRTMEQLFRLSPDYPGTLQQQLRERIAAAILDGHISTGQPLPSSRKLAAQLGIGRNTVMLAYASLLEDGYLQARERSGYYVNPGLLQGRAAGPENARGSDAAGIEPDWSRHLVLQPSRQANILKPANWRDYPYCFVYGQLDPALFPLRHWRECWRERWSAVSAALQRHLPDSAGAPGFGGSSFWVEGPRRLDARELAARAMLEGILIEPGDVHFLDDPPPRHCFRLGYSSIPVERIEPGIRKLANIIGGMI